MKSILKQHQEMVIEKHYTGVTTRFNGYIQFNTIHDEDHNVIGYTSDFIKKCIDIIASPLYLYSRCKGDYINIYHRDNNSPTGVNLAGGIPFELEYLIYAFQNTGSLSPTEDLRTAH